MDASDNGARNEGTFTPLFQRLGHSELTCSGINLESGSLYGTVPPPQKLFSHPCGILG